MSFITYIINNYPSNLHHFIEFNQTIASVSEFIQSQSFCIFSLILFCSAFCFIGFPFDEDEVIDHQGINFTESKESNLNKRSSISESIEQVHEPIKSPKLMPIEQNAKPSKKIIKKIRRNSAPATFGCRFQIFSVQLNLQQEKRPKPNNDLITLLDDKEEIIEQDEKIAQIIINPELQSDARISEIDMNSEFAGKSEIKMQPEFQSDAHEWFMRWNLTEDELSELNYAQKARRYYILSTFGEPEIQNPEPPEKPSIPADSGHPYEQAKRPLCVLNDSGKSWAYFDLSKTAVSNSNEYDFDRPKDELVIFE